ncbi:MAG: class I SAM-dependent methyltransferase [Prevotella sp.]|jgi:SAM-dependent methyltransferase|nr:class I SAM-dependent methyltransferase [Prevotella sp.]
MTIMHNVWKIIDNQVDLNKGANLFHDDSLEFSDSFVEMLNCTKDISTPEIEPLISYAVNKVLQEFYRVNQYYNFNKEAQDSLTSLYRNLLIELRLQSISLEQLLKNHSSYLKEWLQHTNSFASKIYSDKNRKIDTVHCFEYSRELQMDILRLDISDIVEPVLDIGCGKAATLVKFLREKGVEAIGIDRFPSEFPYLHNIDWLDYDYEKNKWGTIISNLGFSNHFIHHHLREEGNYLQYAKKYIQILHSLKPGGSFHYAPDLPFIEQYLDENMYEVAKKRLEKQDLSSVIVKRVKVKKHNYH